MRELRPRKVGYRGDSEKTVAEKPWDHLFSCTHLGNYMQYAPLWK